MTEEQLRRWYDKDAVLKEALELLKLQSESGSNEVASDFVEKLQEEVAKDVIESIYDTVKK